MSLSTVKIVSADMGAMALLKFKLEEREIKLLKINSNEYSKAGG